MAKMNFDKLKKPQKSYLKQMEGAKEEAKNLASENKKTSKKEEKKSEGVKGGRPKIGDEPISKRFSLAFTETEYKKLKEKADRIPIAPYIRDILKDAGVI